MSPDDQDTFAELISQYGNSSSTTWLEKERYHVWRPSECIPESSFLPFQGYMEKDNYIFAWGDPIASSPAALLSITRQFIAFCQSKGKSPVWFCINRELTDILAEEFGWCGISCINDDQVDPAHIVALTSPVAKGKEGRHAVKDLKKNLAKAEKAGVDISEVKSHEWTEEEKLQVGQGISKWKAGRHGIQLASSSFQPWLDSKHRRYWVARVNKHIVGILILTPLKFGSWQIKNCASFPSAPKGTSEALIYTMLKNIDREWSEESGSPIIKPSDFIDLSPPPFPASSDDSEFETAALERITIPSTHSDASSLDEYHIPPKLESISVDFQLHRSILSFSPSRRNVTFGISAAPKLEAVHHLHGWKVKALVNTYSKIMAATGLLRRGEFRHKFDALQAPLYVSYPPDGFGLDGANTLLKALRK